MAPEGEEEEDDLIQLTCKNNNKMQLLEYVLKQLRFTTREESLRKLIGLGIMTSVGAVRIGLFPETTSVLSFFIITFLGTSLICYVTLLNKKFLMKEFSYSPRLFILIEVGFYVTLATLATIIYMIIYDLF